MRSTTHIQYACSSFRVWLSVQVLVPQSRSEGLEDLGVCSAFSLGWYSRAQRCQWFTCRQLSLVSWHCCRCCLRKPSLCCQPLLCGYTKARVKGELSARQEAGLLMVHGGLGLLLPTGSLLWEFVLPTRKPCSLMTQYYRHIQIPNSRAFVFLASPRTKDLCFRVASPP